jgi:hypothetical protein
MNGRPAIREALIAKKMRRWAWIAKGFRVDYSCPPARARKNYWRLLSRYPEIAQKLGMTETSVY